MFRITKNNETIKTTKTVGEAVQFIKEDALSQENECEYKVLQDGFPFSHYTRTAYDLQLEACR